MSKLMLLLKTVFILVALMSVTFFLLGLKSQRGSAPGLVNGKLAPLGSSPNCVSSEADTQPERHVEPLSTNMESAKKVILETGGTITTETDSYIAATYMSKVFKFVDDVELRDAGNGQVHIRSASRVGYSDRGVNKKRVELIRGLLGSVK